MEPKQLDSAVLNRIPLRNNFDDRYFNDKYQALPAEGYTKWIQNMLSHKNIEYHLNVDYFKVAEKFSDYEKLYFTGPIDAFFEDSGLEKLHYRTVHFKQ